MMVEGPGHVPIDEIEANILLQKRMSNNAPYYMLGPIPTDIMAGYDHVAAAIGASYSARYGADLICYITPAEHLALPNEEDVIEGVRVARVGAYIGDMAKYPERRNRDMAMSKARRDLDWEEQFALGFFPEEARAIRDSRSPRTRRSAPCAATSAPTGVPPTCLGISSAAPVSVSHIHPCRREPQRQGTFILIDRQPDVI